MHLIDEYFGFIEGIERNVELELVDYLLPKLDDVQRTGSYGEK
jgi:hypothetical protein